MKSVSKRNSYSTYSQNQPKRFFTKRLMTLFVIMIVGVLVFYYLFSQYRSIETAYRPIEMYHPMINGSQDVSNESSQPEKQNIKKGQSLTFLVVGLDYGHVGRLDEQRADVLLTITMNPTTGDSVLVNISSMLQAGEETFPLYFSYTEGGLEFVQNNVQELLDISLDFTLVVDLSESRSLIEVLGDNRIAIQESMSIEQHSLTAGEVVHLNGRESILFMQSSEIDSNWTNSQRQTQILAAMGRNFINHMTTLTGAFNAADYFEAAEGVVATDLNFESFISLMSGNYLATLDELTVTNLKGSLETVNDASEMPRYERVNEQQLERVQKLLKETLQE